MRTSKKKSMVRTTVVLPVSSFTQVQALATANHVSTAWVIRHAVLKFLVAMIETQYCVTSIGSYQLVSLDQSQ